MTTETEAEVTQEKTWPRPWMGRFLETYSQLGVVKSACTLAGITRKTAYQWREKHPEFAKAWDDAVEDAADVLETEALRRGVTGWDEPIYHQGKQVGTVRKFSDTLLIFMLKGIRPEKFREKLSILTENAVDAEIRRLSELVSKMDSDGTKGSPTEAGETSDAPAPSS